MAEAAGMIEIENSRGIEGIHMRAIAVPGGVVHIYPASPDIPSGLVRTWFEDGTTSNAEGARDAISLAVAHDHGYLDPVTYVIHRELAHHFVAQALGWPVSPVVWANAHAGARPRGWREDWPYRAEDEEHIVDRLLVLMALGQPDPASVLDAIWGSEDELAAVVMHLRAWICPMPIAVIGNAPTLSGRHALRYL